MNTAPDRKRRYPIYLPEEVGRALRRAKAETEQTHSDIVETALRAYLLGDEGPPARRRAARPA